MPLGRMNGANGAPEFVLGSHRQSVSEARASLRVGAVLVLTPLVLPVDFVVLLQKAFYTWKLGVQLRDGQFSISIATLLVYTCHVPDAVASILFIIVVPEHMESTLALGTACAGVAVSILLPRHGGSGAAPLVRAGVLVPRMDIRACDQDSGGGASSDRTGSDRARTSYSGPVPRVALRAPYDPGDGGPVSAAPTQHHQQRLME